LGVARSGPIWSVSIPFSSGQGFSVESVAFKVEEGKLFQSLFHQVRGSQGYAGGLGIAIEDRFNPFFIRSGVLSDADFGRPRVTARGFNPFFIRSGVLRWTPPPSGAPSQRFNPFFIRSGVLSMFMECERRWAYK